MFSVAGEVEHAEFWRDALDLSLGKWAAYDYDDVPDPAPNLYALLTVSKRFGNDFRVSGGRARQGYRLTTLAVGRTVDEARWVRDRVAEAIADRTFTLDGKQTTFVRLETEESIEFDDGRYSGLTAWVYAV